MSAFSSRLLPLLVVLGCSGKPQLPSGYVVASGDQGGARPISRGVLLIADNQQHYLYGEPVWIRTALVDKFVQSAIRAPQLDLFGPSVLEWVLKNHADIAPVIHLGDALNLSCVEEYDRFVATMRHAGKGWFIAPGNHDGIYFGSSSSHSEWAAVCQGGGGPMSKAAFVDRYVREALAGKHASGPVNAATVTDPGTAEFAARFDGRSAGTWTYSGTKTPWLRRVAWRVDPNAPHHSYVVQEIDATFGRGRRARYILLDTSHYEHAPQLVPIPPHVNPGSTGDLRDEQFSIVDGWLEEKDAGAPEPIVVLFGHHPYEALTNRARARLEQLRAKHRVLLYVSAHTHRGGYFIRSGDDSSWLELNVGSLVDWPLEFRSFRVLEFQNEDGSLGVYTNSPLFTLGRIWDDVDAPECDSAWQPQLGDPDYYVDYAQLIGRTPAQTAKFLFDSLLHSYLRLLRHVPSAPENTVWPPGTSSDESLVGAIHRALEAGADAAGLNVKRTLLRELERFDRERGVQARQPVPAAPPPEAPAPEPSGPEEATAETPSGGSVDGTKVHRDYRLCQAMWASQDDETGARRARNDDWYILYPPRQPR